MTSVCVQGEAEAYAIEVKAKAEAEQMAKKADAWKEYKEAALVDMMLQVRNNLIFLKKKIFCDFFCLWVVFILKILFSAHRGLGF